MASLRNANGTVQELAFGHCHHSSISVDARTHTGTGTHAERHTKRLERQEVRVTMCVNMGDKEREETEIERDTLSEMNVLRDIV